LSLLDIDFSNIGNSERISGAGWGGAEADHRWMVGVESELRLPDLDLVDHRLTFATFPYCPGDDPRPQRLQVLVNDIVVLPPTDFREHSKRSIVLPAAALRPHGNIIKFLHPDGRAPLNSQDKRELSFAMFWLTLDRLTADSSAVPIVLVCGTELAHAVFQIVENFQEIKRLFEFRFLWTHADRPLPDRLPSIDAERIRFVWLDASTALSIVPALRAIMPTSAQLVRFPLPRVSALWPTRGRDARSKPELLYPAGRYPAIDVVAASLANADLPDDLLYAKYLAETASVGVAAMRRYDMDRVRWHVADRDADISLANFIETRFFDERMFVTPVGAAPRLIEKLFQTCLGSVQTDVDDVASLYTASVQMLNRYIGPFGVEWPISPIVATALGLKWYSDSLEFRFGNNYWNFREFILRYIRWSHYIP
jgi:hypothetical protein